MRPTATRLDGMPGLALISSLQLNHLWVIVQPTAGIILLFLPLLPQSPWWGDTSMHKQRGVVVYTVSPFRQRGSKAMIRGWLFNGYRRLAAQVPYWIVPFAIGYGTYTWAKRRDAWQNSKAGHIALGGHH
ncbi:hypothetical protein BDR05DRAFT_987715 [Suillus weaverae]|nr:hypothetical protein BDR05DRAFT_987715 [Suillus weaverae]